MASSVSLRRSAILDLLLQDGFADITSLERRFGCSKATIRRDLESLQAANYIRRTRGGAVAVAQRETPFRAKLGTMAEAKQQIALAAAKLVQDGQSIGFTGGTTTLQVARSLTSRTGLVVVTNALTIAMELVNSDAAIVVTGGQLRNKTYELVGPLTEPAATQIHLDTIFVGVDGLSCKFGLTTHNPLEARANRVLIERSDQVVVVADHTKLDQRAFSQIAPIELVDYLVTDSGAPKELLEEYTAAGIQVVTA